MSSKNSESLSSDEKIPRIVQIGAEKMVVQGVAGLVMGLAAGIVLSRGGASSARKVLAGFGAGCGVGAGWTKTSIEIDEFLASQSK